MKRLLTVSLLILSACGNTDIKVNDKITCSPPLQLTDVESQIGLFTSVEDIAKAKAFKDRDYENCIKGLTLIRQFQQEDLKYLKLKKGSKKNGQKI